MARESMGGGEDWQEVEVEQNKIQVWPMEGGGGIRLVYLQLRVETERLKALGQAGTCGSSGERGGLGSDVPGLGCWPGQQ